MAWSFSTARPDRSSWMKESAVLMAIMPLTTMAARDVPHEEGNPGDDEELDHEGIGESTKEAREGSRFFDPDLVGADLVQPVASLLGAQPLGPGADPREALGGRKGAQIEQGPLVFRRAFSQQSHAWEHTTAEGELPESGPGTGAGTSAGQTALTHPASAGRISPDA